MALMNFAEMRKTVIADTNTTSATTSVTNPTPAPTPAPAPKEEATAAEQKPAQSASAKTDKNAKKKLTLIEPKDAFDARQHIIEAAKSQQIVFELSEDQKSRIFADAPGHNVLWTLRKCFRILGGEHNNGEKDNFQWIVPNDALINPNVAVATKSQKQLEYEQKVADGIIKPRTEQGANEQAGKDKGAKSKFTEEQIIKLMCMVNKLVSEETCRVLIKSLQ